MLERLHEQLENTETLIHAEEVLREALTDLKEKSPDTQIFYVAGKVTSDGFEPEKIEKNLDILRERTSDIRFELQIPILSAADVFDMKSIEKYSFTGATNDDYLKLWINILASGLINGIIMTPNWETSVGATAEHDLAKEKSLQIYYYEDIIDRP